MKKSIIPLFLILFIATINTTKANVNFEYLSLERALIKAEKDDKLVFIDVYATWCGPCKMLDKYTFTDYTLSSFFSQNFIAIKINGDIEESERFMYEYDIDAFPTMLVLNSNGELVKKIVGYFEADDLLKKVKSIFNTEERKSVKCSHSDKKKLLQQMIMLQEMGDDDRFNERLKIYLEIEPLDFNDYGDLIVFAISTNNIEDSNVQNFLKDPSILTSENSDLIENKLLDIIEELTVNAVMTNDKNILLNKIDLFFPFFDILYDDITKEDFRKILSDSYDEYR